jgi:hypothetical protein
LQLAPDEREYLFAVAEVAPAVPARQSGPPEVAARLRHLLDTMTDVPAMVLNRRMDVLSGTAAQPLCWPTSVPRPGPAQLDPADLPG